MPKTIDENMIPFIHNIVFQKCTPAWELSDYKLETWNLTYVVQGEARYTVNGQAVDLAEGSLLTLPSGSLCRGFSYPDRLMHCFLVDFTLKNAKNRELNPPFPLCSLPGRCEDIVHMFHEMAFSWLNKQPGYIIKSRGLFLQIIHRFMELLIYQADSNTGDSRINKALRYISAHYSEHVTAKMMAEMAGLNPTYFGILFREAMGVSFNRYLLQMRVKNAENMLISGGYKVGSVAEACGFTDVSHFYKQFKSIKGYPPSHCLPKKF